MLIETKKANTIKSETLGKELEKEAEIIGSLQDLDDDSNKLNTGKKFKVAVPYMDERVTSSHLASIDSEYEKKQSITDLTNVISAFSTSEVSPLSVDSISIEDSSNQFQEVKTLNVRYKTDEGKPLSFSIDVPKMVDDKYLYLGGDKKVIKKQMVRLPIVKTTPNRVELTSNYAKMTIERTSGKLSRRNSYLLRKLKEVENNKAFEIEYGDNSVVNSKLGYSNDFEYEELASTILKIKSGKYYLCFNRDDMQDETDLLDIPDDFLGSTKTPLGLEKVSDETKALIYIENTHIYKYDLLTNKSTEIKDSMFNFLVEDVLKLDMNNLPTIGRSFIYTKVKFLATTYPLLAVAASQDGLTNILKRYNVKYYFTQKSEKRLDYIEVKFKDKYLHYEDLMKNTLLLNALSVMNTQDYEYSMFDADIPYTHYFINLLGPSVGMHTRNTLRINLDVFIDPITKDILRDLKQPTNIIDVLLYANTLLVGNQYKPLNDLTNYRFRSNEIVNDVLYKIIAEAYVNYQKHKINGKPINLSVNKGQLIKELVELPNINGKSTLNPIIELENIAQSSAKGFRGVNINSAYTLEMRAYDESMNGFLSANATPYSGQTSITRSISYDPKITSVRGYVPKIDQNEISATNMLDPAELLSSFTVAGADSPRQAINLCCPI